MSASGTYADTNIGRRETLASEGGQGGATPFEVNLGTSEDGPATRAKKRRASIVYVVLVALGLLTFALDIEAGWRAAGLGLLFPGAGFIAAGGWPLLLLPVSLALFCASLIAWFESGMVVAPIAIWALSAVGAGLLAKEPVWIGSPFVALGLLVAFVAIVQSMGEKTRAAQLARREERVKILPTAAAVYQRAAAAPAPDGRELTPDQLAALRYDLDLALQPIESFEGLSVDRAIPDVCSALSDEQYRLCPCHGAGNLHAELPRLYQSRAAQCHRKEPQQEGLGLLALGTALGAFIDHI
jgi:hypothetical protein